MNHAIINPLSQYRSITHLFIEHKFLIGTIIIVWMVLELLFWCLIHYGLLPKLQPLSKPLNYQGCELELVKKILDTIDSLETY